MLNIKVTMHLAATQPSMKEGTPSSHEESIHHRRSYEILPNAHSLAEILMVSAA
jgi:hypothetical protein